MKRLFTVLVGLMCFSNIVNAQGIEFIHDIDSALVIAKKTNRFIFIDFFTEDRFSELKTLGFDKIAVGISELSDFGSHSDRKDFSF